MFSVMLCLIDRLHIKDKKSDYSLVFGSLLRSPTLVLWSYILFFGVRAKLLAMNVLHRHVYLLIRTNICSPVKN